MKIKTTWNKLKEIQSTQLDQWEIVLKPEISKALRLAVGSKTFDFESPDMEVDFDDISELIPRGNKIDSIVSNWMYNPSTLPVA